MIKFNQLTIISLAIIVLVGGAMVESAKKDKLLELSKDYSYAGMALNPDKTACPKATDEDCQECCVNKGLSRNDKLSFKEDNGCVCDKYAYVI